MFKKTNTILIAALLAIILIVYHTWVLSQGILTHGDWTYFFPEAQEYFFRYSFLVWNNISSFGRVALEVGQAPTFFMYGLLLNVFGTTYAINERVIYYWPIAFLTPLASYVLLAKIFQSRIAVFIGVLMYAFNTYFLVIETGHLTLMTVFALAPLVIYAYMRTLESRKLVWAVITSLLFYLTTVYEPRGSYILFGVLFLYALYHYILTKKTPFFKQSVKYAGIATLPFILTGLLTFHWIIALANVGVLASNELFQRTIYGNDFYNILNAFTLFHPFWTGGSLAIGTSQPILPLFWLVPLFAILGVIVQRKNATVVFFAGIALIGIFLTKQSDIPFAGVYAWLYGHFPGFNAFRESSKFYFLTALGYSILLGAFFAWLWQHKLHDAKKIYGRYLLTALVIVFFLANTIPLITGQIGTIFVPRNPRQDFLTVRDYVLKRPGFYRTLWVPVTSRWSVQSAEHPMLNLATVSEADWYPFVLDAKQNDLRKSNLVTALELPYFSQLLSLSSIRYVMVTSRLQNTEEDWVGAKDNRAEYINAVEKSRALKKVVTGTRGITVYENMQYRPHIYQTAVPESLKESIPYTAVQYRFINPTEYSVRLNHVSKPVYLHFTDTFHPDWKLHVGTFSWLEVLQEKQYALPDTIHQKNTANMNTYVLNPAEICKNNPCVKHGDGSYSFDLRLYFRPQVYLYFDGIISAATLLACLLYLAYYGIKKTTHTN